MADNKDTVRDRIVTGSKTCTTTRAKLVVDPTFCVKGITIRAKTGNSVAAFIGSDNVTADDDVTSGGFPLAAAESIFIPAEDISKIYVVCASSSPVVSWLAV